MAARRPLTLGSFFITKVISEMTDSTTPDNFDPSNKPEIGTQSAAASTDDYSMHLQDMAMEYRHAVMMRKPPSPDEVISSLILTNDNRMIRDLCAELQICSKAEFDRAAKRERIREALGSAPATATELIQAFVKKHKVKVKYDGSMSREVEPILVDAFGNRHVVTEDDRKIGIVDMSASFLIDAKTNINRLDLEREIRMFNSDFKMGFAREDIADAVEHWFKDAQKERLLEIYVKLEGKEAYCNAPQAWLDLADKVFDCSETSPAFVAAVLRKFVWQTKRKMRNLPVTDHLMPVVLGGQGIGKSTFVNRFLSPVEELKLNVDFKMITDDRNVDIWSSYVMFLDEMGYASKADIDSVKNVITATRLTRRPMRTNAQVTIGQNATFIGCSNKELGQLIRDQTGIRRFVGIRMRADADHAFINTAHWALMWSDVGLHDADPMVGFKAQLGAMQEETRELARVEQWMAEFDGRALAYEDKVNRAGNITGANLYLAFREYEEEMFPGNFKTSKQEWDQEMNRIKNNQPGAMIFKKDRGTAGTMYRWMGERAEKGTSSVVDLMEVLANRT